MKTTENQQIDHWKVVNVDKETNEIIMLDYLFDHGNGFKGATGTRFEPVTKERYDEILGMDDDEIAEYLIDMGLELPDHHKKGGYRGYLEWAAQFTDDDKLRMFTDDSYSQHWEELRKYGFPEDKYPIFHCNGGGRIFDKDFKGNKNPKLCALIRKYENK